MPATSAAPMLTVSSPGVRRRHVFVVGLHRSGTSILAELLKAHPKISGHQVAEMPPELENEGQHIQRVFPPDDALGGPGFFAFNPLAHCTETSPLATLEKAAQLEREWGAHWDAGSSIVVEKSPSSLLRMRLLQQLFPDAYFLVLLRHPVCNAYATLKWGIANGGKNHLSNEDIPGFVEHWLAAHKLLEADLPYLRHVRLVHLEQLADQPQAVLDSICADLDVSPYTLPAGKVSREVNNKYAKEWSREYADVRARVAAHAAAIEKYGYSLGRLEAVPNAPSRLGKPTAFAAGVVLRAGDTPEGKRALAPPLANGAPPLANGRAAAHKNGHAPGTNGVVDGGASKRALAPAADAAGGGGVAKAPRRAASGGGAGAVRRPLLLSFGTRGDVQPLIPLALEMQSRGMQPLLVTLPLFRGLVEGSGVAFGSLVEDDDDESAAPPKVDDASEGFFLEGVAKFYDAHGEGMVRSVRKLVSSHGADCIVVGSLIFFLKWLRTLELPLVHTRFSPYAAKEGESMVEAHAHDVVHFLSLSRKFGLTRCIRAEAELPDQDLLGAIKDMKLELTLLAYADGCEAGCEAGCEEAPSSAAAAPAPAPADREGGDTAPSQQRLPGLPTVHTGFWLTPLAAGYTPPPALAAFLADTREASQPICLNFGSMAVYDEPWAPELLAALQQPKRRIVAVGAHVPPFVREWKETIWVETVPHAYLFPRCCCVVHHGGSGTTAAVAAAGVPSVVVSYLGWSDQPRFGEWVSRTGAGVHLCPADCFCASSFESALLRALEPKTRQAAAALRERLGAPQQGKSGAAVAVDAIVAHVHAPPSAELTTCLTQLDALRALPLSEGGKLRAGLYCLLREPSALPLQTYAARDSWLKSLGTNLVEAPLYKADWPVRHLPLDLAVHDLPHASSLIEWWYFHAHLTATDGTPFCVFVALFQIKIGGETLSHVHASMLVRGERHVYYSGGEPHAAETVLSHRRPKHDEYFERALLEVFQKKRLPAPDVIAPQRFKVPADKMDFDAGRLSMRKDSDGRYHVGVKPEPRSEAPDAFGFDLVFTPSKPAVRNGIDGVSPGVGSDDAMFYYSITRMEVEGCVRPQDGSGAFTVRGSGWYDHEFGGDASRASGGKGIKVMDVQWCWTGVQLDDGTEITYAKTTDNLGKGTLVDKAVLVDEGGASCLRDAELTQTGTWTSLDTFIAYGRSWVLDLPEEGTKLELSAVADAQELISVISTPAYWEGQVAVSGTKRGKAVKGYGFVEQYFGSQNQNFRNMLQAVSDVVLRNVDSVFPYAPSREHMVQLVVSKEFAPMMEGLPTDVFVDQLVRPVRAITDRQGKGWRSMGLLLASSVVGGEPSKLERYTSFPEFLHTGSLIIDDIQDNSLLRRGGPCAHIEFGVPTAINAGTAAYFLGEGITRDHPNLTDQQRLRIYELYFTCLRGAHVGQALDINGMDHMMERCLAEGDFEPMWQTLLCCHRLKSGLPASICARTGAVLGSATTEQEAALGEYFLSMGLGFQIIDDVINLQGFGKSLKTKAEDLIEGKITAPVIRCLMLLRSQPEKQKWLWGQYSVEKEKRDIGGMVELIEASGAFDECIREAHGLVETAWKLVDAAVPDSFAKVCLRAFGWFVCKVRDY